MTLLWQLKRGNDLYKYVTYKPKGGDALVKAAREEIYNGPGEALYAAVDTYLVDITWIAKLSWKNDTDAEQRYSVECTTEFRITQGSEVNKGYSVASAYKGMTVTMEGQKKVLKNTETTEMKTITVDVIVPPRSRLVFYQRRYSFKSSMFFILDTQGKDWSVCSWGGYNLSTKDCTVEVFSEDYATLETELDGYTTGTMDVATVSAVTGQGTFKMRENCTERCKKKLEEMRV